MGKLLAQFLDQNQSVDRRRTDVIFKEFPLQGSRLSASHGSRTTTNQGGYDYSVSTPGHLASRWINSEA